MCYQNPAMKTKIFSLRPMEMWKHFPLLFQGGMEMVWASLWYAGLFSEQVRIPWWGIWLIFWGILLFSYGLRTAMIHVKRWEIAFQSVFLLWALTAGILSLKWIFYFQVGIGWKTLLLSPWYALTGAEESFLPFFHTLMMPLIILRGIALANSIPEISQVLVDFQTGLVGILLFGLFYLPVQPELSATGLFLYLWIGLVTLSSTRIYGVSAFRGGKLSAINPAWALGLFVFSGLVILLGLLSGALFSSYLGKFLLQIIIVLIAILGGLIILVAFPLLIGVMRLLIWVFERFGGRMNEIQNAIQKALEQTQAYSVQWIESQQKTISTLKIAIPLLVLLAVLAAVWLWLRHQSQSQNLQEEEETQSERPGLSNLFFSNRKSRQKKSRFSPQQLLAIARIRRIYHQFETLCARAGTPRPTSATPLEFAEQCNEHFPEVRKDIQIITQTYVQVRYGEIPETPEAWKQVLEAWKNVEHFLKTKKPAREQALKRNTIS